MTDFPLNSSDALTRLAHQFLSGELAIDSFWQGLYELSAAGLDHATLDLDRRRRCGYPEVIFGERKSFEALSAITARLVAAGEPVLATRISPEQAAWLREPFPAGRYNPVARTWRLDGSSSAPVAAKCEGSVGGQRTGHARSMVAVVTAGTGDLPVAEEAAETIDWMGLEVLRISDVGVAGPQRLIPHIPRLRSCAAVIVVAGMDGALPSVVAGHVAVPVIAVPTSVGYGVCFGGVAPLLTMLNSCAANVVVVNIDAGFKAGFVAGMIAAPVASKPDAPDA